SAAAMDMSHPLPEGEGRGEGKWTQRHAEMAMQQEHSDLTQIGRRMLRLPMHPRYSRMLVEAANHRCVPAAALCAALVSGRDLLMRVGRDDQHMAEARELFEASQESDFFTLMRAYQFAKRCNFNIDQCRRYGVHAQTARQAEQTFEQLMQLAERNRLIESRESGSDAKGAAAALSFAATGQSQPTAGQGPLVDS